MISTPRRFGKTISVCLFVAALLFACPSIEISIYSTCKRISGKLLRNCTRFLTLICDGLKIPELPYIKQSQDEVELQGPESKYDTRRLNSYPSKVPCVCVFCMCACLQARNPLVCTRFVVGSYLFVKKVPRCTYASAIKIRIFTQKHEPRSAPFSTPPSSQLEQGVLCCGHEIDFFSTTAVFQENTHKHVVKLCQRQMVVLVYIHF